MSAHSSYDLGRVLHEVDRVADGASTIDISDLIHNRARHLDLVAWSVLAWWLLGQEVNERTRSVILPQPSSAPLRYLGRTGLMAAANRNSIDLQYVNGTAFKLRHLLQKPEEHHPRLPGIDWEAYDVSDDDILRILPDLAGSPCRLVREEWSGLFFPWLQCFKIGSPSLSGERSFEFIDDVDTVMFELLANVKKWSNASRAFASVSMTQGGGTDSWNRLHIIVADNGKGIPKALKEDLDALTAVHDAADGSHDALEDIDLLRTLLFKAFEARDLPNHNGDGLKKTQIRAGKWIGALDIFTVNCSGNIVSMGTRGLGEDYVDTNPLLSGIPNARGTLVHLMMQATDNIKTREEAAMQEGLEFLTFDFDEAVNILYG